MACSRPFPATSARIVIPPFARGRSCAICRRPLCGPIGSIRRAAPLPEDDDLTSLAPRDRLIVALDMPDVDDARRLVEQIGDSAVFYKVGMELTYGGGPPLASELVA